MNSGARLVESPFDLDNNQIFNRSDYINAGDLNGDDGDEYLTVSGRKSTQGIISTPRIVVIEGDDSLENREGFEDKYMSGSSGGVEKIK